MIETAPLLTRLSDALMRWNRDDQAANAALIRSELDAAMETVAHLEACYDIVS